MHQVYIENMRYLKLKKLFKIFKAEIRLNGFSYACRIGFEELRKQKWHLFEPDEIPNIFEKIEDDPHQSYLLWRKTHQKIIKEKTIIQNKINRLKYRPKISLILILNNKTQTPKNLKDSIKSVVNQLYDNWELVIINKNDPVKKTDLLKQFKISNDSRVILKSTPNLNEGILNNIISQTYGELIGFLNHGDILTEDALFQIIKVLNVNPESDIIYTDEDYLDDQGKRINPFFKPCLSKYMLLCMNYLKRFCLIRRKIFEASGGFKNGFKESKHYDLILRCTELTENITHVPLPLCSYHQNIISNNGETDKKAISDALVRRKIHGKVGDGFFSNTYRIRFSLETEPKVSIIICTKDNKNFLKRCIKSIEKNTNYKNWEIIIVDNNSKEKKTISYLSSLSYLVVKYDLPFNYSKMNNLGALKAKGEYLLFLNDDIEALDDDWLTEMVSICKQKDVGVVGAKLVYSDDTIQHAGMIFLKNGFAFHPYERKSYLDQGYFGLLNIIREYSSITGACLLTKKKLFDKVGMFDEKFDVYYGDSDLCFKIKKIGYVVVYTPYALLRHYGSIKTKQYSNIFIDVENHYHFTKKWPQFQHGDPFYNPNLGWDYHIDVFQK